MNNLKSLSITSVTALLFAWSSLSNAGAEGPMNYTTVSKASVKIQGFEQTGEGEAEKVTLNTNDVINYLRDEDEGTKVPKNLQLVLLNYCGNPEGDNALAVWDKDTDDFTQADVACLWTEGAALFNDDKDTVYRPLEVNSAAFMMDEIDVDAQIKLGKVKGSLIEERPDCLKSFSTMAMSGYNNAGGNGSEGSRVMRKSGSIKTSGSVFEVLDGDRVGNFCE